MLHTHDMVVAGADVLSVHILSSAHMHAPLSHLTSLTKYKNSKVKFLRISQW